jgi:hypothetical protein
MSKKIRTVLTAILLCSIPVAAQVNTSSPYSRFGLGELTPSGFAQNLSMGGTGIGIRSGSQLNYLNPASYSEMDTMSFLFDFGVQGSQTTYSQNTLTENTLSSKLTNYNIHHIAIGFGITKNWKASVGIVPYSSVGYNIVETRYLTGVGFPDYNYKGTGGLNRLYIGNSLRFFNHFSAGLNLTYIFGYLDYTNSVDFPAGSDAASTVIENRLNIGDMMYNLGFQYHETFYNKYFLTVGAIFDNDTKLKTSRTILQTSYFPGSGPRSGDTIVPSFIVNYEKIPSETLLPRNMGVGISFGIKDKLMLTGDYSGQEWSKSIIPGKTDSLDNSNSLNFGLEYTPNNQAIRGYYNRVHYRFGGYYSNTYLRIRGEQLQDYGISFGVGLPFKNTKSSFNLGVVVGQRGTLTNNLIKESYGIVNFGLTLHDFWFFKRKFD